MGAGPDTHSSHTEWCRSGICYQEKSRMHHQQNPSRDGWTSICMLKQKEQSETGWMKVNEEVCNKPNPRAEEENIETRMQNFENFDARSTSRWLF